MKTRLLVSRIRETASLRPKGYVEDVLSRGTVTLVGGLEVLELSALELEALREKYRSYPAPPPHAPPPKAVPARDVSAPAAPAAPTPLDLSRTDAPSFLTKVKNFAVSAANHVAAGMPMASDAEILRRHDICMACEFFKDNACQKCGCPIIRAKQYVSKLSWADSECPVGKWGKEAPSGDKA